MIIIHGEKWLSYSGEDEEEDRDDDQLINMATGLKEFFYVRFSSSQPLLRGFYLLAIWEEKTKKKRKQDKIVEKFMKGGEDEKWRQS